MWWVVVGVGLTVAITVLAGPRAGGLTLAGVLMAAGVFRGILAAPGRFGITIRSRFADVALFMGLGAAIAVLALTTPSL